MKIVSIKKVNYSGKVYNIGVRDNNNYFASNILVHNCYVSSNPNGEYYTNVCDTWKKFIATFAPDKKEKNITITEKPFQIAIGSEGSADESPEFCDFLETVYNTGVVPNYTTNGVILF